MSLTHAIEKANITRAFSNWLFQQRTNILKINQKLEECIAKREKGARRGLKIWEHEKEVWKQEVLRYWDNTDGLDFFLKKKNTDPDGNNKDIRHPRTFRFKEWTCTNTMCHGQCGLPTPDGQQKKTRSRFMFRFIERVHQSRMLRRYHAHEFDLDLIPPEKPLTEVRKPTGFGLLDNILKVVSPRSRSRNKSGSSLRTHILDTGSHKGSVSPILPPNFDDKDVTSDVTNCSSVTGSQISVMYFDPSEMESPVEQTPKVKEENLEAKTDGPCTCCLCALSNNDKVVNNNDVTDNNNNNANDSYIDLVDNNNFANFADVHSFIRVLANAV